MKIEKRFSLLTWRTRRAKAARPRTCVSHFHLDRFPGARLFARTAFGRTRQFFGAAGEKKNSQETQFVAKTMNWAFEYSMCLEWDTNLQYRYDDFQSISKFIITQRMSLCCNHSNIVRPNVEFYVTITVADSIIIMHAVTILRENRIQF